MNGLKVLDISRSKYTIDFQSFVPNHTHDYNQFLYVLSGQGEITLNEARYLPSPHDVFVIKPGAIHSISSNEKDPLYTVEIKFDCQDLKVLEILYDNTPVRLDEYVRAVYSLLGKIIDEAVRKKQFYKEMITECLGEVLLLVARQHYHLTGSNEIMIDRFTDYAEEKEINQIETVIDYLNKHYQRKVTVSELTEVSNLNRVCIWRLFKSLYNQSPIQYLNLMRLEKAKELLMLSSLNITEISEATGFQSVHYFSRCFSAKEGISPNQFRKIAKRNIYVFFDKPLYSESELAQKHPGIKYNR